MKLILSSRNPTRVIVTAVAAVLVLASSAAGCGFLDKHVDVLLIGDSIMNQSGDFVLAQLRKQPTLDEVKVRKEAVNGSGLLTPTVYDWMSKAEAVVKETTPTIVVVLFIGNYTDTDLFVSSKGQPIPNTYQQDFFEEWRIQAKNLTQMIQRHGSRVDWVLPPPFKGDEGARRERLMRETYVELARELPGVGLIDGRQALGGANGEFAWRLADLNGSDQIVRQGDAVHLTEAGGQLLARQIVFAVAPTLAELKRQRSAT